MELNLDNMPDQEAPVSFDDATASADQPKVSLREAEAAPPIPLVPAAKSRAMKMDLGLGTTSPGYQELFSSLQRGEEKRVRDAQAFQANLDRQEKQLTVFRNLALSGKELEEGDIKDLATAASKQNITITPEIATEYQYARAAMRNIQQAGMVKDMVEGWEKGQPENLAMGFQLGAGVLARQEVLRTTLENAEARARDSGFTDTAMAAGKAIGLGMVALDWLPTANVVPGQKMPPSTPGGIMYNQVAYLHTLPVPEMKEKLDYVMSHLNAFEAKQFAEAMINYTSAHSYATNFWTVFSVASMFLPGAKVELKQGLNIAKQNTLSPLSDVERKIMSLRSSPMTVDFDRPFFNEFNVIKEIDGSMRGQVVPRLSTAGEMLRAQEGMKGMAETLEGVNKLPSKLIVPGTIQDLEVARPLSSLEVQMAAASLDRTMPKEEAVAFVNAWKQVGTMIKDVTVATAADSPPKVEKILEAVGDTVQAARVKVANDPMVANPQTFVDRLPNVLRGDKFLADPGTFDREATTRLGTLWTSQAESLLGTLTGHAKFDRLSPEALNAAFDATERMMKDSLPPNMANRVLNVIRTPGNRPNEPLNVSYVTAVLGKSDGTPFSSWDAAQRAATYDFRLGKGNFKIEAEQDPAKVAQYGAGHYVTITAPVDETVDEARLFATSNMNELFKMPSNFFSKLKRVGFWWNTAAPYVLSDSNMQARHIALHGAQAIQNANKQVANEIAKLNKSEFRNLVAVFEKDRAYQQDDKIGRFANTLGEFEQNYIAEFGAKPSEQQAAAYFSYRNLNDINYIHLNLGYKRDLERQGIMQYRFQDRDKHWSPYFMGKEVNDLPMQNNKSAGVYLRDTNHDTYLRTSNMSPEIREYIERGMEEGWLKAIQVANPLERPLAGTIKTKGDYVNYMVVPRYQRRAIDEYSVPYHEGGHKEYQATHYTKQAIVSHSGGRANYEGDITVLGSMSSAEADTYTKALNTARLLYKNKDIVGLRDYLAKNLPEEHFSVKEFINRFEGPGNGYKWNVDEPFITVQSGKTVHQTDKSMPNRYAHTIFENEHDSPYNLMRDVDKRFLGSRDPDLWAIKELGSEQQPLFKVESAPMIDVMTSLNRSVSSSSHARLINDYKIKSAEQFIENFYPYMSESIENLRKNPQYYMLNPPWEKTAANAPYIATGKAARANILQFVGMDPPDVKGIKWMQNEMVSMLYKGFGQDVSHYLSDKLIARATRPEDYVKRVASSMNLGMYNPLQFVAQLQAVVNSWALAGMDGLKGTMGMIAHARLSLTKDPAVIDHVDDLVAKSYTGWKKGWLKQSIEEYDRGGFGLVQGDTSWRDDIKDVTMIQSATGKFLEAGYMFFKAGEKGGRMTAWHTAFLEWKQKNPNAVFDDVIMGRVLARANQLNNDMTKASSAPVEQGLWTIPTQFWQYQLRLFGQLNPFSPRTTPYEKARAYAVYGAAYGLPTVAGINVALWPMTESIRQYALENNMKWDNTHLSYALMEGLPSYMLSSITGKDYQDRFGPGGIKAFRDLLYSDSGAEGVAKLLGGASGTKIADIAKPIGGAVAGMFDGVVNGNIRFWDGPNKPIVANDWEQGIRTIASVNAAFRDYYAFNHKAYYTKSGRLVSDDIDKMDATIMTTLGLTPRKISDTFLNLDTMKHEAEVKRKAETEITNSMRHALESLKNNDQDSYEKHMRLARTHFVGAGFRPLEWNAVMTKVGKELLPLADSVSADYHLWKATPQRQEQYINKLMQGQ